MVPMLLEQGYAVTVLDNFMHQSTSLVDCCNNPAFHVVRGDCRDRTLLGKALRDADMIIPLAAIVGAPACDNDQVAARSTNLEAIEQLIQMRSARQRIVYPTTNSGYGIGEKGKFCTEETPLRPISLYGTTKSQAEQLVLDAGNSVTFRLATVFGMSPRMRIDLLVNDFVYRAVTDRTVTVFEGHAKRNYIHVRDVARVFLHAFANFDRMQGQVFNVGLSDANLSKLELCAKIKQWVSGFVYLEAPIGCDPDQRDYVVSNEKIERTGFTPIHSLDMGIQELLKGYSILRRSQYANVA
jgi:nucleoside-diphosphate-sugar epimerase